MYTAARAVQRAGHRATRTRTLTTTPAALTQGNGLPGDRLPRLKQLMDENKGKRPLRIMETHNGLTGLIVEAASATNQAGEVVSFDGMWSSSLTASSAMGKPDIEAVDTTSRLALVEETLAVTSKPLIYDADSGGIPEIFRFTVRSLENLGVSAAIIEDKTGLKQNSLFGTDRKQQLEDIDTFCLKIKAGLEAKRDPSFQIVSRLEALIAGYGQDEALKRAEAYVAAGTDAVMIHSKNKAPDEILLFLENYHKALGNDAVPIIAVPTTYNVLTEEDLASAGVSICIYANHLLRAAYPTMLETAESILTHSRSLEIDGKLLPVKKILTLIDENPLNPSEKKEKAAGDAAPAEKTQVDPVDFFNHIQSEGVNFFAGVPDSLLAPFCATVDAHAERHLITANEGSAICTAAGHHFATGEVPCVYLQNSGLGNTVNPILSLAHKQVYGTPMVVMIGWRGEPGVKDEPQHGVQGRLTKAMLETMEMKTFVMPNNDADAKAMMTEAVAATKALMQPVAVLVPKGTFAGIKAVADEDASDVRPTREKAIAQVLAEAVGPTDAVVSTTGYASREVYEARVLAGQSHEQDFLTVGSMGHALSIAQGIAMAQPERTVWCIDGDGATLMHMGNMAVAGAVATPNLRHVLMNNEKHDSVGGQPTAAATGNIDFTKVAAACGFSTTDAAGTPEELSAALATMKDGCGGKAGFLEVKLAPGTRGDLGRPKVTTPQAKANYMKFLGSA